MIPSGVLFLSIVFRFFLSPNSKFRIFHKTFVWRVTIKSYYFSSNFVDNVENFVYKSVFAIKSLRPLWKTFRRFGANSPCISQVLCIVTKPLADTLPQSYQYDSICLAALVSVRFYMPRRTLTGPPSKSANSKIVSDFEGSTLRAAYVAYGFRLSTSGRRR